MPRTCFVIMPFSGTQSCTSEEWSQVFESLFKSAIEGAGLGYECRRSEANRGNIVAGIIRDLNDAYVVLADLTDRNANVFYELGVRHALRNRTIIVAQSREDLPFDLQSYATHVYDWKSDEGKKQFAEKIRQLLQEIDTNPERSDNPVGDFLQETPQPKLTFSATARIPEEVYFARSLVGPSGDGQDVVALTRNFARKGPPRAAKEIYRRTRPELLKQLTSIVSELNQKNAPGSVQTSDIQSIAQGFVSAGEPCVIAIEQFALASVEEHWKEGVFECINFAGDMISLSESPRDGRNLRFATGLPALLAWKLLVLMGARAWAEAAYDLVILILRHPIEVETHGRFSHRSLLDREDLFYAESFLGYADQSVIYLRDSWDRLPHLHDFFQSKDDFHFQIAQFLMIVSLAHAAKEDQAGMYPGYKLVPQASRAMSALCGRLASMPSYKEDIAKIIVNDDASALDSKWQSLASQLNSAGLGRGYWLHDGPKFPATLDGKNQEQ